jgi:hypothetical protein
MSFFSFLKSFFLPKKKTIETIACPFCLRENLKEAKQCVGCKGEIAENYKRHYAREKLMAIPIIGFSQTGKTVFVDSVACTLFDLSDKQFWKDLTITPIDSETESWIEGDILPSRARGQAPLPTGKEGHFKRVLLAKGIPLWKDRIFCLRDVAGEHFQTFTFAPEVEEFCIQSKCAIFIIDVNDVLNNPTRRFDTLFDKYVRTIVESGAKLAGRKIVIVLAKADLYRDRLPDNLRSYLDNDPLYRIPQSAKSPYQINLSDPAALSHHAKVTLPMIDSQLATWVGSLENGGPQLNSKAKSEGVEIRYTLVSGWGSNPDQGADVKPLRMLDPLTWLLEFHSREG